MIVILKRDADVMQVEAVSRLLLQAGYVPVCWQEPDYSVVGAVGMTNPSSEETLTERLERLTYVDRVARGTNNYPLVSRDWKAAPSIIPICSDLAIGGEELVMIAGPCAVESRERLMQAAREVKECGADMLRGGAFKPRTSPHSFQGLGVEGLEYLRDARQETGLPIVTEVMETCDLDAVESVADVLQIGSRNMQNYALLKAVGRTRKPVLLKRGMSATVDEWLQAAEYILTGGNPRVILCERGIRTFETATRNTLDLNAIPLLKRLTHLPVIVDPSHGTGRADLVVPMSLAAIAAGADGLILEVHPSPETAVSDGPQSLTPRRFSELICRALPVAQAVGRTLRCVS